MPYVSIRLPTPSPFEITLYYIFLLSLAVKFHSGKENFRYIKLFAAVACLGLLATPASIHLSRLLSTSTTVSILDVGHGAATVLQLPHNKSILIDGGGETSTNFNIGERVIAPFLWKRRIRKLAAVIISHPHADHYNGLDFILNNFNPETIWLNGMPGDDPEYEKLIRLAGKLNIRIRTAETGEIIFRSGKSELLCVNNGFLNENRSENQKPGRSPGSDVNNKSLVLRLETENHSFLFPADISAAMAENLIAEGKNLQADILLAPHHGSKSSMSQEFVKKVDPEYIAVSEGRNNQFNIPGAYLDELEKRGIQVYQTGRDGTLSFSEKDKKIILSRYQVN